MSDVKRKTDTDPVETREWVEALQAVIGQDGPERAHSLIEALVETARRSGAYLPYNATTAYLNTIHPADEEKRPGDPGIERRLRSLVRWNAMAMVVRANRDHSGLGGHIATYQSAATLYEVGFNHFFRGPSGDHGGDLVYFQAHSAPGIYARAFLEGRLTREQLECYRLEVTQPGLSAYPHPMLMPDFWQFSTVSLGLAPLLAIYQARFMKYLHHRGLVNTENRKVWAFLGDGEMDEPEAQGAISLAVRERLDNLIFVVNCNLQRLDGPVRGNGKIIQELESNFRGAGWNVIKVIWGSGWDRLLANDLGGLLRQRLEEAVDGDFQAYAAKGGAYIREHLFGKYPELTAAVADMSDDDLWRLSRGGHDPDKVYAAYAAAVEHRGQPTVILAKTIKGYGLGEAGEGANPTHQQKKLSAEQLKAFRDRFDIPIKDEDLKDAPFYKPAEDSPEIRYLQERRAQLGGCLPARYPVTTPLGIPGLDTFQPLLEGSGDREMSTTMAFVRVLTILVRDQEIGKRVVPIVADEARTFGMEGMFRQVGIYAPFGQLYTPVDAEQLLSYREDASGQILEEGVTEAGAISSWIAAATSYANHGLHTIPFFIFYSMFGFQRVGDLIWAAADMQARGFLIGATSGRTTLNGEGLQHQDGHSHLLASTVPSCIAYDPAYAYELAVITQHGMRRMFQDLEPVFFYITTLNENYLQPPMPPGTEVGIVRGMYLVRGSRPVKARRSRKDGSTVQLLGSGAILREVEAAAQLLEQDFGIAANVWSVTSFTELRRDGLRTERWNRLHPAGPRRLSYPEELLTPTDGPIIAASDYMKIHADQIRAFVPRRYVALGTDGFGRSDTRQGLRRFFEVDRFHVVVAALSALAEEGEIQAAEVASAIEAYGLDPESAPPCER